MLKKSKKELKTTRTYRANVEEHKAMRSKWRKSDTKLPFTTWIVWLCSK